MKDALNLSISALALLVSVGSTVFVAVQVRAYLRQLRFETLSRILDINRQLILVGFEHPELFSVIEGHELPDEKKQKRYLQLWLNQVHLMWLAHRDNLIDEGHWDGHSKDFQGLANLESFKAHWRNARLFYEQGFQEFIDSLIVKTPAIDRIQTL